MAPLNHHQHVVENLLFYVGLLLFSFINHTQWVPDYYLARRYRRYATTVVLCLLAVVYIPHRIEQLVFLRPPQQPTLLGWAGQLFWKENLAPPRPPSNEYRPPREQEPRGRGRPPRDRRGLLPVVTLGAKLGLIFLLGLISSLMSVSWHASNRLRQIENDKLNAQLQQLKAQIHPHFLFNTLNSIYALAIRHDERTADTIVKLSEFMRYMLRDAHQQKVSLQKEVQYISNYIELQRARLRDAVDIEYSQEGSVENGQIAPLILFTFIENAFKHGVNPDEDSLIRITLTHNEDQLRLSVFNKQVNRGPLEDSTGIGLQNTKERLRLLYPGAHQLIIDDNPIHFSVELTLTLQ